VLLRTAQYVRIWSNLEVFFQRRRATVSLLGSLLGGLRKIVQSRAIAHYVSLLTAPTELRRTLDHINLLHCLTDSQLHSLLQHCALYSRLPK
jgi:hypothetical protein